MIRRPLLLALGGAALVTGVLAGAPGASAHPLGNLTTNTYAGIVVAPDSVGITYVLDLAELPTVQLRSAIDADGNGEIGTSEADAHRATGCAELAGGLGVTADGSRVPLTVTESTLTFPPGQAGLVTTRLTCALTGPVSITAATTVGVVDDNYTDRIGWREITVVGDRVTVMAEVPDRSISDELRAYPLDVTPLRTLATTFAADPGGAALATTSADAVDPGAPAVQSRGADGITERFQELVASRELTLGLLAAAIGLAFVLGAVHAMAPGHGKTMMAAAVVARRGTVRQVVGIGATVTLTHTAGVLALGSLIWFSDAIAPEAALPWLTVASGVLVAGLGLTLLVRRFVFGHQGHGHHHLALAGLGHHDHPHHDAHDAHDHPHHDAHDHGHHDHHDHHDHDHDHGHGHGHGHGRDHHDDHGHGHDHDHGLGHADDGRPLDRRWVVAMGVAGGLVPTPSALVVLLGAAALGRAWLGVALVGVYGLGMAATLLAAGILLVRVQAWLERHWFDRAWLRLGMRIAPVATAAVLVIGGTSIILRGALAA